MTYPGSLGLASAVGGLLLVERKAFLQAGFSRPLVACTLIGLCLGDAEAGAVVGVPLELFFLGAAHLGAALSDHETLCACAVGAAAVGGRPSLALLLLLPIGALGRWADVADNAIRQRLADRVMALAEQGQAAQAVRRNLRPLWFPFLTGALTTALGAIAGIALSEVPLASGVQPALGAAFALAVAGAAGVLGSRHPRAQKLGLGSAAVAAVALLAALIARGPGEAP